MPVNDFARELNRISRLKYISARTVSVFDDAVQHVDELDSRMLEQRKDFAVLVQSNEHWLHDLVWTAHLTEELVSMAGPRSATRDLHPLTGANNKSVVVLLETTKERGERDRKGFRQADERAEAWKSLCTLDL